MPLRSLGELHTQLTGFVRARLWLQVLIAMFLGIAAGVAMGPGTGWLEPATAHTVTNWLAMPGHVFLALIQMIVIPLVVASIVLGMAAGGSVTQLRDTGARVVVFFLLTTVAAVVIGVAVALLIRPGDYVDRELIASVSESAPDGVVGETRQLKLGDLPARIVDLVPSNPLRAGVEQNMMQVVLFAALLGIALMSLSKDNARPLLDLLRAVQAVAMVVVHWAMFLVPLAVFGLLAQITTRLGLDALLGMGVYVLTVLLGLAAVVVMYLLIYALKRRESPLFFLRASSEVLLLAFSTSSSAAVMPVSLRTAEDKLGISPGLAQFVIPLGVTINMAGTALYQVVATLFLAQVFGVDVDFGELLLIVVLAVGASIGSPGTPGVGIVILAMLLGSIGIPASGIALIIGVDRILDMCRTTVNVAGDLIACMVLDVKKQDSASAHHNE
ncbi:MAG: dicarboxylate/amino acid:cation symporter [Burkholderiales bacterium]|nr:dicarboxylate/amino acid:cation symporter [Burkholderiales bacterium]